MANLLYPIGWNLLIAAVMALAVWLACRTPLFRRRPAVCHGLWLLVLLKLVTPPVSSMSAWTDSYNLETAVTCPCGESNCTCSSLMASASQTSATRANDTPTSTSLLILIPLLGVSLLGTSILWIVAARKFLCVRRLLQGGAVETGRAVELLRQVSRKFELRSSVKLHIVDAPISPMLWAVPSKAAIILPRRLAESLDDGLRNIFAHELAHYVRRDHWFSLGAWIAATLFWWNPLVWFARRQLSASAETCCDALALDQLHGSRKSYAQTLLTVVDSLTAPVPHRSAFGIPFAESRSLRRRFDLIADTHVKARGSRTGWILMPVGVAALLILPVRAQENAAQAAFSPIRPAAASAVESPSDDSQIKFSAMCCPS